MTDEIRRNEIEYYPDYQDKTFAPYVEALGQLTLAWNGLHEKMGALYDLICGSGPMNVNFAVWHSLKSDAVQRDILLAAARNRFGAFPDKVSAIKKLVDETNSIRELRNNALHSPLVLHYQNIGEPMAAPATLFGNKRAKGLEEKNLLKEFNYCRDAAMVLRSYCGHLWWAIFRNDVPWPDKPDMPNRGDSKNSQRPKSQT